MADVFGRDLVHVAVSMAGRASVAGGGPRSRRSRFTSLHLFALLDVVFWTPMLVPLRRRPCPAPSRCRSSPCAAGPRRRDRTQGSRGPEFVDRKHQITERMSAFRTCRAVAVGTAWRSTAAMPAEAGGACARSRSQGRCCRRPPKPWPKLANPLTSSTPSGIEHHRAMQIERGHSGPRSACRRTAGRETRSPGRTARSRRIRFVHGRRGGADGERAESICRASCRLCRWDPRCRR